MYTKILKSCSFACVSLLFLAGNAMADLIIAEGKPTGQSYNPDRDGEGFYVEVIDSGETAQCLFAPKTAPGFALKIAPP